MKTAIAILLLTTLIGGNHAARSARAQQQQRRRASSAPVKATKQAPDSRRAAAETAAKSRQDLIEATRVYQKSLRELLVFRERDVAQAADKSAKLKELYEQGLVSRKQLEDSVTALAAAKSVAGETRAQIGASDALIAQTLEESKLAEELARAPAAPRGSLLRTVAYVRFNGSAAWSIADAARVQGFFQSSFGRPLPISAFGQTALHNQLGFDHRHAVDVALHPDSAEGQSLINYLRQADVPFIAFRQAIAGSATGPHIHIGRPSHRIAR